MRLSARDDLFALRSAEICLSLRLLAAGYLFALCSAAACRAEHRLPVCHFVAERPPVGILLQPEGQYHGLLLFRLSSGAVHYSLRQIDQPFLPRLDTDFIHQAKKSLSLCNHLPPGCIVIRIDKEVPVYDLSLHLCTGSSLYKIHLDALVTVFHLLHFR